jgi:integrase/recombinase XerC
MMNELIITFLDMLENQKNYSKHTIKSYQRDLLDFEAFIINEELAASLLDVTRERLGRHYLVYLDERKYTQKSVARKISTLRSFYAHLVKEKQIKVNIFDHLDLPKVPKKIPKIIHDEEIERLFQSINKNTHLGYRNYVLLDLLFSCGLRASELTEMKIIDIRLSQSQILIHGKGSKDRYVPLHDHLINDLRHYLTYVRPNLIAKGPHTFVEEVFINYKGTPLTVRGLQVILKKIIENSGETYKIHPHMMRHAFATTLLNHGADLRVVQELLGHEHLKSTQIYTQVSAEILKEKYKKSHPRMIKK